MVDCEAACGRDVFPDRRRHLRYVGCKKTKNKNSPRICGLLFHNEGGDSFEWFINYLRYSIVKKCEQSMSIF